MEKAIPQYLTLIVMGDFNLHIHEDSNAIVDFKNSLFTLGLEQYVDFSTHTGGHSLDLDITESVNGVNIQSCEPGPFISDHCVVKTVLNIKKESVVSKTAVPRNYKTLTRSNFLVI